MGNVESLPSVAGIVKAEERSRFSTLFFTRLVPLFGGLLEAVCVFLLALSKVGVFVGITALLTAEKVSWFHSDQIRIPVLAAAVIASLINLYMLWNSWRLRNASSASWRKRRLTFSERARNVLLFTLSILTVAAVASEIYLHPLHWF